MNSADIYKKNLDLLRQNHPDIYSMITNSQCETIGQIEKCSNGLATLKLTSETGEEILAYNRENPWRDTDVHLSTVPEGSHHVAVLVGMGLGYGALRVVRERPDLMKIVIVEPILEIFYTALHYVDLEALFTADNVEFLLGNFIETDLERKLGRHAITGDLYILRHVPSFEWKKAVYEKSDNQTFETLNKLSAMGGTTSKYGAKQLENRLNNYSLLRHVKSVDTLKDNFLNIPAALIAAGPSLNKSIATIKKIRDKCLIIAVDSALAPLNANGIVPDIVTSIDYQDANLEKMVPFLGKEMPYTLVVSTKVTSLIPKRFGVKNLLYGFQHDLPQINSIKALGVNTLIEQSSSVANMALGVALLTGCSPIVFFGQDLSYPDDSSKSDHAANTIIHSSGLPEGKEIYYAEGRNDKSLPTERGMLVEKKQFEDMIAKYPDRLLLNATVSGLKIEGADFIDEHELTSYFQKEAKARKVLKEAIDNAPSLDIDTFIENFTSILKTGEEVVKKIEEKKQDQKVCVRLLSDLSKNRKKAASIDALPKKIKKIVLNVDKQNNLIDDNDVLWNEILELTFNFLRKNDLRVAENQQVLKNRGYVEWLKQEMLRFEDIDNKRLESLETYLSKLGSVLNHLINEKKTSNNSDGCHAARSYLKTGDIWLAAQNSGPECSIERKLSNLLLFNFDHDEVKLSSLVKSSPEYMDLAERLIDQECNTWVETIADYGPQCPALIGKWIERIDKICQDPEKSFQYISLAWGKILPDLNKLKEEKKFNSLLKALKEWDQFVQRIPEIALLSGIALNELEQPDKAINYLEIACKAYPEDAYCLQLLARSYFESGDFDKGINALNQAVKIDRSSAVLWDELGDVMFEAGSIDDALPCYEQCFLALPERLDILLKIGDCYLKKGELNAALASFQTVAAKTPEDTNVIKRIQKLQEVIMLQKSIKT